MALKIESRIPYGNARDIEIATGGDEPEVRFAAAPHGGPETLWFCFTLTEEEPDKPHADKVKITLKHVRNMLGGQHPASFRPAYHPKGHQWFRTKVGVPTTADDGQVCVSWTIPYPDPRTTFAFCYPYGPPEIRMLVQKSKGHWKQDTIGLSQGNRPIVRLSNDYGKRDGNQGGLYLLARQHSGETPGSWVLDGLLDQFSRVKRNPFLIWAVPLTNIDGVLKGDYGKDNFPWDMNRAWGSPPMRHENLVIQRDMHEWKTRCRPALVIDFHAPGGSETDGIYAFIPDADDHPDAHRDAAAWANVIAQGLGKDYAADNFKRVANYPSRWETSRLPDFCRDSLQVPALCLETPYATCKRTLMQQKQYRDAGKRIADAILKRK